MNETYVDGRQYALTTVQAVVQLPKRLALLLVEVALVLQDVDAARLAEPVQLGLPLRDEGRGQHDDDGAFAELVVLRPPYQRP